MKKVIWAVDPFVTNPDLQFRTAHALKALTAGQDAQVEPVCVVSKHHSDIPIHAYGSDKLVISGAPVVLETASPKEALKKWATAVELRNILEPKCLAVDSSSIRDAVQKLVSYAKESKADLVAIGTRAREGFSRMLMGSFAETLLSYSDLDLFVVNPHTEQTSRYKEILFPSDASLRSVEAFERVLSLARNLKTGLTLFHKLPQVLEEEGTKASRREIAREKSELNRWKGKANEAGVPCELEIGEEKMESIAESILKYSSRIKSGLIVMETTEGPVSAAVFGSVTRQVVRHADCPVLVVHAKKMLP